MQRQINCIDAGGQSRLTERAGTWVIAVGGGHGDFIFNGNEAEAEEMRRHKAKWEGAIALKRLADDDEIKTGEASQCWGHVNFTHIAKGFKYSCGCCA